MSTNQKTRLLVVGSMAPAVSGTVILLRQLLEDLQQGGNIEVDVIDTAGMRGRGLGALFRYLRLCAALPLRARRTDVISVQVMGTAVPYLIFPVLLGLVFARKPAMLRLFGGWDFRGDHAILRRVCLWFCNRFDMVVVETRLMADSLRRAGVGQIEVFYNNRRMPKEESPPEHPGPARRFVYLSYVRPEKGVHLVVEAAKVLPADCSVDVYGPMVGGIEAQLFNGVPNLRYCGIVAPEAVPRVLADYDVLLLPTYFEHEGHPGIILEAFAAGVPVVATRWRALPELFDDESGILIEPRKLDALIAAMRLLAADSRLYRRLSAGAYRRRLEFSAEKWLAVFESFVERLRLPKP